MALMSGVNNVKLKIQFQGQFFTCPFNLGKLDWLFLTPCLVRNDLRKKELLVEKAHTGSGLKFTF